MQYPAVVYVVVTLLFILVIGTGLEFFSRNVYRNALNIPALKDGVVKVKYILGENPANGEQFQTIPYGLYWNGSNYSHLGFQQTDINGFRYKGYDIGEKKKFRILVYGGSTTFSDYCIADPSKSWPELLERLILENDGRDIEIINAGLNYALTSELLSHYVFIGHSLQPDMIFLHGPGNDLLPISVGDSTMDYRATRKSLKWDVRQFERELLSKFGFLRVIYCYWLRKSQFLQLEPSGWDPIEIQNDRMLKTYPSAFKNNVESLVILCKERNTPLVLIDFLLNSLSAIERIKPGLSEGMIEINRKMNEIFHSISQTNSNTSHIAFNQLDFPESHFVDTCHLNEEGELKKALIIYRELKHQKLV